MKKIVCNVLYCPCVPVFYKRAGMHNYKLGVFAEEKDAFIAGEIFGFVIKNVKLEDTPESFYSPRLEEIIVPEEDIRRIDYNNIDEFIEHNRYVREFNNTHSSSFIHQLKVVATQKFEDLKEEEAGSS